jgi:hypothetical protein
MKMTSPAMVDPSPQGHTPPLDIVADMNAVN